MIVTVWLALELPITWGRGIRDNEMEQGFPFSQQLSFEDFLVDLNEFYQGYKQGFAHGHDSWAEKSSKHQSFYFEDNEVKMIDFNSSEDKTSPVSTKKNLTGESQRSTEEKPSYLDEWNFEKTVRIVDSKDSKLVKTPKPTTPPLTEDIFNSWKTPSKNNNSSSKRKQKFFELQIVPEEIPRLPLENLLNIKSTPESLNEAESTNRTFEVDPCNKMTKSYIRRRRRRRKRKKSKILEEVQIVLSPKDEGNSTPRSLYKWFKQLKEEGKFGL